MQAEKESKGKDTHRQIVEVAERLFRQSLRAMVAYRRPGAELSDDGAGGTLLAAQPGQAEEWPHIAVLLAGAERVPIWDLACLQHG